MIIFRGKYIDRRKEEVGMGEQCIPNMGKVPLALDGLMWWMKGCLICPQIFLFFVLLFFCISQIPFLFQHCVNILITINSYKKFWVLLEKNILKIMLFNMYHTSANKCQTSRKWLLPFFSTPDFNKMTSTFLSPTEQAANNASRPQKPLPHTP